jgi:hypothetical protein
MGVGGFTKPNTTQTPDVLFDVWLTRLRGSELRVLLYAVRRTFGWKKDSDDISLDQFARGITAQDGRVLDYGTGLSRASVKRAIKGLIDHGLLIKTRGVRPNAGDGVNNYRLRVIDPRTQTVMSGFQVPNTTQVPDELFDYWMPRCSDPELRVMLYLIRRTLGFGKLSDVITEDQLLRGVRRRDGVVLDEGCGLSRKHLYLAIAGLNEKGLITVTHRISPMYGSIAPIYSLVFSGDVPLAVAPPDPRQAPLDPVGDMGDTSSDRVEQQGLNRTIPGAQKDDTQGSRRQHLGPNGTSPEDQQDDTQGSARSYPRFAVTTPGAQADASPVASVLAPQQTVPSNRSIQETDSTTATTVQQQQTSVVVLKTDVAISSYPLGTDEVLIETEEGHAKVLTLPALVRDDVEATLRNYGLRIATECYYSADQYLGIGGDEWMPDEERKRAYHLTLRREMETLCQDIGACTIDEGLAQYFSADLIAQFHSDDPDEQQRQRGWMRYIRGKAGDNLQNPAGFLRSRLQSGLWPPRGGARSRR